MRDEYYHDADAPRANTLVPAASAVVVDEAGRVLLQRRRDGGGWSLPGGTMEIGESIGGCVVREVREETGLEVEPVRIVGVYSDPCRVIAFADGEVRQEFSICFACRITAGALAAGEESSEVGFFHPAELAELDLPEQTRLRLDDYLADRGPAIR